MFFFFFILLFFFKKKNPQVIDRGITCRYCIGRENATSTVVRGGRGGGKKTQKTGQEIRTRRSRDLKKIVIWKKIKKKRGRESVELS